MVFGLLESPSLPLSKTLVYTSFFFLCSIGRSASWCCFCSVVARVKMSMWVYQCTFLCSVFKLLIAGVTFTSGVFRSVSVTLLDAMCFFITNLCFPLQLFYFILYTRIWSLACSSTLSFALLACVSDKRRLFECERVTLCRSLQWSKRTFGLLLIV